MRPAVSARAGGRGKSISRSAPAQQRTRRTKSPAPPAAAGTVLAPPVRPPGGLQLGPGGVLQLQLAEEQLGRQAQRPVDGGNNMDSSSSSSPAGTPVLLPPPVRTAARPAAAVAAPPLPPGPKQPTMKPGMLLNGAVPFRPRQRLLQPPHPPQPESKVQEPQSPQQRKAQGSKRPASDTPPQPQQREEKQQKRQPKQQQKRRGSGKGKAKPQRSIITPKRQDLMGWYSDATRAAERAFRQATRGGGGGGTAEPSSPSFSSSLGHALRAPVQAWLDEELEGMGFEPRAFPPLAPLGLPHTAAGGAAGGQPEAGGGAGWASESPRGGSGTLLSHAFASWAEEAGGRLPLLASQWHDVPGSLWEPANAGLLLQECHAAHAHCGTADSHAQAMIGLYERFAREVAALPAVAGRRSRRGTLRGAAATYSLEVFVGEGCALQAAAAHHLADNYSSLLGASYQDAEGQEQHLQQMGGGLRASALAAAALEHGDDAGLRLPPALAPLQAVIVPRWPKGGEGGELAGEAERLRALLAAAGVRAAVDARRVRPGLRRGGAACLGAPLVIEVAPRDVAARTCTLLPRASPPALGGGADDHAPAPLTVSTEGGGALAAAVGALLEEVQAGMRQAAERRLEAAVIDVTSYHELREVVAAGLWARGPWAGSLEDELAVQAETGASLRCFPLVQPTSLARGFTTCLYSGYQATEVAIFGRQL